MNAQHSNHLVFTYRAAAHTQTHKISTTIAFNVKPQTGDQKTQTIRCTKCVQCSGVQRVCINDKINISWFFWQVLRVHWATYENMYFYFVTQLRFSFFLFFFFCLLLLKMALITMKR